MRKFCWRGRRYSGSIAASFALSSIIVCGSAMGAQAMRPDGCVFRSMADSIAI